MNCIKKLIWLNSFLNTVLLITIITAESYNILFKILVSLCSIITTDEFLFIITEILIDSETAMNYILNKLLKLIRC